ncbi:MAG: acetate/propionate family kinase [Polyangiaceae bacterium]
MSGVLSLNCGSSSLKYALFEGDDAALRGSIDRIGAGGAADHAAAVRAVFDELSRRGLPAPAAVGHRLVHGGPDHLAPERIDDRLLAALAALVPFAPIHLPSELAAIRAVSERFPEAPQVACFDTAFHRTLPEVARRFALPAALFDAGLRRYGFHGLSCEYVVESLGADRLGRAVIAHLGNGASMTAVRDGRSIETTMGFTPTAGLVMGTRSGDLDPGLLIYLLEHRGYDAPALDRLVNHEAGLLGISGTTADMQALLERRATDPRAELAVAIFCHHARKAIGSLAAALGGLDGLVFTGGIGEHAPAVRREICSGLDHLGISADDARPGQCQVQVVHTDEERMIARHTRRRLGLEGAATDAPPN